MEIENPDFLERAMGIEPTYSAWKAAALPLCYARILLSSESFVIIHPFFFFVKGDFIRTPHLFY